MVESTKYTYYRVCVSCVAQRAEAKLRAALCVGVGRSSSVCHKSQVTTRRNQPRYSPPFKIRLICNCSLLAALYAAVYSLHYLLAAGVHLASGTMPTLSKRQCSGKLNAMKSSRVARKIEPETLGMEDDAYLIVGEDDEYDMEVFLSTRSITDGDLIWDRRGYQKKAVPLVMASERHSST